MSAIDFRIAQTGMSILDFRVQVGGSMEETAGIVTGITTASTTITTGTTDVGMAIGEAIGTRRLYGEALDGGSDP